MLRAFALLLSATFLYSAHGLQYIPDTPSPFTSASQDAAKYVVTLSNKVETNPPDGRFVVMADASGTQYRCQLPNGTSGTAAAPVAIEDDEPVRSPQDLLDSLEGMCLYRQDGPWTYEICYKQHVRQMHQSTKEEHSCGAYQEPEDQEADGGAAEGAPDDGVRIDRSTVGPALPYLSHTFTGGADCLLTQRPRTSEVRFTCMEEGGQNMVTSVREFPTCNYVFIVSTPFLCKHPRFRPKEDIVQAINCTLLHSHDTGATAPGAAESHSGDEPGLHEGVAHASVELLQEPDEGGIADGADVGGGVAQEGGQGSVHEDVEADGVASEGLLDRVQQSFVDGVEAEAAEQPPQPPQDDPVHGEL